MARDREFWSVSRRCGCDSVVCGLDPTERAGCTALHSTGTGGWYSAGRGQSPAAAVQLLASPHCLPPCLAPCLPASLLPCPLHPAARLQGGVSHRKRLCQGWLPCLPPRRHRDIAAPLPLPPPPAPEGPQSAGGKVPAGGGGGTGKLPAEQKQRGVLCALNGGGGGGSCCQRTRACSPGACRLDTPTAQLCSHLDGCCRRRWRGCSRRRRTRSSGQHRRCKRRKRQSSGSRWDKDLAVPPNMCLAALLRFNCAGRCPNWRAPACQLGQGWGEPERSTALLHLPPPAAPDTAIAAADCCCRCRCCCCRARSS